MKFKKFMAMCMALCMVLALCACGADQTEQPSDQPSIPAAVDPINDLNTDPNSEVTFGLQTAPDPDFDSPATGTDSGKLYTIVGDYAYELDPTTLQPTGDPLDPITHEPVDNPVLDGDNPSTPNNPQNSQPPTSEPPAQSDPPANDPSPSPSADTSLPNMGMFLEDD